MSKNTKIFRVQSVKALASIGINHEMGSKDKILKNFVNYGPNRRKCLFLQPSSV